MKRIALLTTLLALSLPAAAGADDDVFGGPVRTGENQGIVVTLSGWSARTTVLDQASDQSERLARNGRVFCRMQRGDNVAKRSRKKPSKRLDDGARWNFKKPLMTVGEGYCRISYKGKSLKVVFD